MSVPCRFLLPLPHICRRGCEKVPRQGRSLSPRVITAVAPMHGKVTPGFWINPFFDVLHPSPMQTDDNVMFFFARDRAGITTDATVLIDDNP